MNKKQKTFESTFFANIDGTLRKVGMRVDDSISVDSLRHAFLMHHVDGLADPNYPNEIFIFTRSASINHQHSTNN